MTNLIEFDIELWKTGKYDVVMRDGRAVDGLHEFTGLGNSEFSLYGVTNSSLKCWRSDGRYYNGIGQSSYNLMLKPKARKKRVWFVYYDLGSTQLAETYNSEERARASSKMACRRDGWTVLDIFSREIEVGTSTTVYYDCETIVYEK